MSNRTGGRCRLPAIRGGTVCHVHGGRAPQVKRAAARRLAIQEAREIVAHLGVGVDADPLDVLLEQVREAAGNVAAYRLAVETMGLHVGAGGVAAPVGDDGRAEAHVLVRMYDAERDRLARMAKLCLDAGIDERKVRVAEQQAQRLGVAVARALDDQAVGLTPGQRDALRQALARELRGLAG